MITSPLDAIFNHSRIVGTLLIREMTTRYGREGLGFIWVIGEPLLFCFGVIIMWGLIKPPYEHGIRLGPLVMTGYMSLLLYRHMISFSLGAVESNTGLLYHRAIKPMHVFLARNALEFIGGTIAFAIVYLVLMSIGQVSLPEDWLLLYGGWFLVGWVAFGLGLLFAGLAMRFEVMERIVPLITYAMVPLSGAFFMVSWLPAEARETYLLVPMPHGIEMVRAGVFGEYVPTYYHPFYALAVGAVLLIVGMLLISSSRHRIVVD